MLDLTVTEIRVFKQYMGVSREKLLYKEMSGETRKSGKVDKEILKFRVEALRTTFFAWYPTAFFCFMNACTPLS